MPTTTDRFDGNGNDNNNEFNSGRLQSPHPPTAHTFDINGNGNNNEFNSGGLQSHHQQQVIYLMEIKY